MTYMTTITSKALQEENSESVKDCYQFFNDILKVFDN